MEKNTPLRQQSLAGNMDTGFLKVLALLFMLIDHLGAKVLPGIPEMRMIGRLALPLYAWCLVVGNVKTRSPLRYLGRLFLLAVISQPLYMMALDHPWNYLNILFLLSLATFAIQGIRLNKFCSAIWAPILSYILVGLLSVDYGWKGLTFILLLYFARESRGGLAATMVAFCLFWGSGGSINSIFGIPLNYNLIPGLTDPLRAFFRLQSLAVFALPLLLIPTRTNLKLPKWLGYGIYPLHLVLLILIRLFTHTGSIQKMLSWFGF